MAATKWTYYRQTYFLFLLECCRNQRKENEAFQVSFLCSEVPKQNTGSHMMPSGTGVLSKSKVSETVELILRNIQN